MVMDSLKIGENVKPKVKKPALTMMTIMFALFMSACSTSQSHRDMPPEKWRWAEETVAARSNPQNRQLMERFRQFWSHYYWLELEQRYQMELPAFQARFSKDFYVKYYAKRWDVVEFAVNAVEMPKAGEVVFQVWFKQRGELNGKITAMEVPLADVWVLEGDNWYHKANDPMLKY
jgi:hypothetical protein